MFEDPGDHILRGIVEKMKIEVWQKARVIEGHDPNIFREDISGNTIRYLDEGKNSEFGWRVCCLVPLPKGGTTEPENLVPLHWQNSAIKNTQIVVFPKMGVFDG